MAELGTSQSSGLFQDWYDRYVKPKKYSLETPAASPETSMPASPTPTPSATVPDPAAAPDPVVALPAEAAPSLTDRFSAGLSRVGEGLKDPAKMGLLGMGLSMMATPPRQVPYSNTEILGRSGLAGVSMYEKALEAKRKDELMKQTAEEHTLARQDQAFYRQGTLEDRAAQRVIQKQNADSAEAIRKATAESRTGKLVPVKQADGTVAYERMLDAVGQQVPQPAAKAAQKYKNVPGVGMVDISGPEPVVKIKAPVFGRGGGPGGKPTANIQNIEYLVGNGWNRKEAEDVVLHGKRMPRENFIANMTKSIYGNEFIDDADKASKMQEAIRFYDSTIPQRGGGAKKPAASGKALDQATATSILQEAGGDKDKARKLAKERGFVF